ncbi:nitroreductase family protein [Eikenella sp. Marseille-P7795]|uniref:nitroreductase family protein n=1 Tax=Eikenella sp. Marseille-P7795 TaxID=2866577 RepID=UPI001CE4AAC6|nr:nitroreductase family protein [Eikenella sp. Marseille-P7795]
MNTLDLLTTRRSVRLLTAPGPDAAQLETILQAATQVPDHGNHTPWHFVVVQSEAGWQTFRHVLGQCAAEIGGEAARKAEVLGQMAPLMIGVVAKPNLNCLKPKPEWEQVLSAGCAAYAIQLAAKAQGFDNVWLTGLWVNTAALREAFACEEHDKIIGLLMIGTAQKTADGGKNTDLSELVSYW